MEFLLLPAEEAAVRRYAEELWLPFNRDLEEVVDSFELVDEEDSYIIENEMEFRMDRLESEDTQILVAFEPPDDEEMVQEIAVADGDLVGFIETSIDEASEVFDRPDRLMVCDFYVKEGYRGEGLAQDLMESAVERAQEEGCPELVLNVDVDNGRAIRFYEKVGFETARKEMRASTNAVLERLEE